MKPYYRQVTSTIWLSRRPYILFMIRELTAIFVGGYCVFLLFFVHKVSQGPEAYAQMIEALKSPVSIILHLIALAFAVYHSVTWFNLTPKIMVLQLGEERVPPFLIAGVNFAAWLGLSVILAWVIIGV